MSVENVFFVIDGFPHFDHVFCNQPIPLQRIQPTLKLLLCAGNFLQFLHEDYERIIQFLSVITVLYSNINILGLLLQQIFNLHLPLRRSSYSVNCCFPSSHSFIFVSKSPFNSSIRSSLSCFFCVKTSIDSFCVMACSS